MAYMIKSNNQNPTNAATPAIKTNPNVGITTIPNKPNIIDKAKQVFAQKN